MTEDEILKAVKDILLEAGMFDLPPANHDPLDAYGYDSLVTAMAILALERQFKFRVHPDDLGRFKLKTLQSFLDLVQEKLAGQKP